jgi:NADPH2:quinone reductase
MKAIQVKAFGGPEALTLNEMPLPEPGEGQVRVKVHAAGVNFIDIYQRTGRYGMALPFTPGQEGAGVVDAVGPGADAVAPGARVAWIGLTAGSYGEYQVVPAWRLIPLPEAVDFLHGAAIPLQAMTVHMLVQDVWSLQPGQTALIHAAAGGVGLWLVQAARQIGARVIGTVSTAAKADLARQAGADEIILYNETDFEAEVKRLTVGRGVDVVYDSVGKTTFEKGLNCLRPRGMMVLFGGASGAAPVIDPIMLMQKGSLYLTRPSLYHYVATPEEFARRARDVMAWARSGRFTVTVGAHYPLAQAAQAHRDLEARRTVGKVVLTIVD